MKTTAIACAAAAGLPILLAAARAAALAAALAGRHPAWHVEPVNLAEAAATRDAATVARLIDAGADVNGEYRVRRGLLRDRTLRVSALEAARMAGRTEIELLLVEAGAR